MISISINGEKKSLDKSLTVSALLEQLHIDAALVVIEYNQRIITKKDFDKITCQDQDQLEIAQFMGGG